MANIGQYAKNIAMLVGQSFFQRMLGMVLTVILARTLGAAGFGTYSVVMTTSNSAFGLVRLGVDAAIHVRTAEGFKTDESRRRIEQLLAAGLLLLVISGCVGAFACIAFAGPLAAMVYDKPELAVWIRVAGAAVFLYSLWQFCYATLAGLHRFAEYTLAMVGVAVLNLAAISIGALSFGVSGAVTGLISVQAISVLWLGRVLLSALRREQLWFAFRNTWSNARSLLEIGLPLYVAGLISIPAIYLLQGIVVRSAGLEELGFLRVVVAIVSIVSFAPSSAAAAMTSMFTRTRTEQQGALAYRIMQNIRVVLVFALLTATGIMVLLPWLVPLIFGTQYFAAIGPASVALLTAVLTSITTVVHTALLSSRKMMFLFIAMVLQAVVFFAVGTALIPVYGLTGYLAAELLGYLTALAFVMVVALPWLRANGVRLGWVMSACLPFIFMGAYAVRRVVWADTPTVQEGIVGVGAFAALLMWVSFTMLRTEERGRLIGLLHAIRLSLMNTINRRVQ